MWWRNAETVLRRRVDRRKVSSAGWARRRSLAGCSGRNDQPQYRPTSSLRPPNVLLRYCPSVQRVGGVRGCMFWPLAEKSQVSCRVAAIDRNVITCAAPVRNGWRGTADSPSNRPGGSVEAIAADARRRRPDGRPSRRAVCPSAPAVRFIALAIFFTGDLFREYLLIRARPALTKLGG